jgi:hypothetical protein
MYRVYQILPKQGTDVVIAYTPIGGACIPFLYDAQYGIMNPRLLTGIKTGEITVKHLASY